MFSYHRYRPGPDFLAKIIALYLLLSFCAAVQAEELVTVQDPLVPTADLELMLLPLTKDELALEVEAWRDLLKQKVKAITQWEIQSRKLQQRFDDAQAELGDAASAEPAIEQAEAKFDENKDQVVQKLTRLREDKSKIFRRFATVVNAYEAKGAEPEKIEEFRKYGEVVSGVTVEISDQKAVLAIIKNWFVSSEGGIRWAQTAAKFFAVMAAFWVLSIISYKLTQRATDRSQTISGLLKTFLNKFVKRAVLFVGLLVALSSVGFNVSALAALVGGGAFIIGFALQDTLSNFAAGVMLLLYRPFDVGDFVEVGGILGKVDNVSLVNTNIRSVDNKVILVPNKQVWGEVITNATASSQRRVDFVFGIGYSDDIDKARAILEQLVSEHELILKDPEPVVEVNALGESSVDFICRPWVRTEDYWRVYWDLTRQVKLAFDAQGISIPFPQRDIHIYQAAAEEKNKPEPASSQQQQPSQHKTGLQDSPAEEADEEAQPS